MSARSFSFGPFTPRVRFGFGVLEELPSLLEGYTSPFLVSTPGRAETTERVAQLLGASGSARFDGATAHTPVAVTDAAARVLEKAGADVLVAVGGGSATGLAKALALRSGLSVAAIPTTYAGSEMTSILGQGDGQRKWTERHDLVRPRVVCYDVELTVGLSARTSAASGANALAHATDALFDEDASPLHLEYAAEAIRLLGHGLVRLATAPGDLDARADALYAAFLSGMCLDQCAMGLHHRLCHLLGGRYDLPHAETHAVLLPHAALAYGAGPGATRLADALEVGPGDGPLALFALFERLGLPMSLSSLGLEEDAARIVAGLALEAGPTRPRALSEGEIEALLSAATRGEAPSP